MQISDALGLTGPAAISDMIGSVSAELAERIGRPDIDAATIRNAALELAARDCNGSRSDEDVLTALSQIASQFSDQLALTAPAAEDWAADEIRLTRATDFATEKDARLWSRQEVMRLTAQHGGPGGVIRLTPPTVSDAYDAACGDDCDCCLDETDAQVQRILAQYPHVFEDGRQFKANAAGTLGSTPDGWADPTDHRAPKLGGRGGHPDVEAIVARNPDLFGSGAQVDRSQGNINGTPPGRYGPADPGTINRSYGNRYGTGS